MRVLFVTAGLQLGGAEHQLKLLAESMKKLGAQPQVLAVTSGGALARAYRDCGLEVHEISTGGALGISKLIRVIDLSQPSVIQGWMYRGNLAATLAAIVRRSAVPLVWGVRGGAPWRIAAQPSRLGPLLLSTSISFVPRAIVYNSLRSKQEHGVLGFPRAKAAVIPNIITPERWMDAAQVRHLTRQRLSLQPGTPVIGLVARWHKTKGHELFFSAIELIASRRPETRFLLAGEGIDERNAALCAAIERLSCRTHIRLLGARADIAEVTAALDVACCCSVSEGSPNSVAEALLAGVPVVSTDVGDAPELIGGFGEVVCSRAHCHFAEACERWMDLEPKRRSALAAEHAAKRAKLGGAEDVSLQYLSLYRELVTQNATRVNDTRDQIKR
jgi:glycosyltransferase involved in cell wall biosynthesis